MSDSSSKRRYPRLGALKLVILREVDGELRKEPSRTRSMGPGGLSLEVGDELPVGAVLGLHLALGDEMLKLAGRVAYCRPLPAEGFEVGVEYTELEPGTHRSLLGHLERQATVAASIFATSLAVDITRCIEGRRTEEPKIGHEDCLAALDLVRLRLEQRAAEDGQDPDDPRR